MAKDRQQSGTKETPGEAQRHSGEVAEQTGGSQSGGSEETKAYGGQSKSQPQGGTSGRDTMSREKEQPEKHSKQQRRKEQHPHPLLGKDTEVREGEPTKTEPSKTKKPAA